MRPMSWQPCGLITLTTDYGLQDPFVGVMKGSILRCFAQAQIVDLTHSITAFQPQQAGFWLARCSRYFPSGTVHVAVVDPGVGSVRRIIAVRGTLGDAAHCWLAPDNGLLQPLLAALAGASGEMSIHDCDLARLGRCGVRDVSATFHGRDIFAPLAASLAAGRATPDEFGASLTIADLHVGAIPARVAGAGSVVVIDHFGNLITDIECPAVPPLRDFEVQAGGRTLPLRRTYGDVAKGEFLALRNAFGVVEIARREGSAALGLDLELGSAVALVSKS
jgi:S-adenosyl-L-methionine hydrolase (adenosine-forming)